MGETGEKNRNMTICGRHSTNLQNFMSFTITYLSFASSWDALTTLKQDDTINLT